MPGSAHARRVLGGAHDPNLALGRLHKSPVSGVRDDTGVMAHRKRTGRRTPMQVAADEASQALMRKLGLMLRDGRRRSRARQLDASAKAGISRSEWSGLELGRKSATLATWNRAAFAMGGSLEAYIKQASAADRPRDAVHLRHQELVIRAALGGGWQALPEELIDREARTSRAVDVLLRRTGARDGRSEYALCEVWDWLDDVGAAVRDMTRRLEAADRYAVARMRGDEPLPRVGGFWLVRATQRNRALIAEHRHFFRARFPGSGRAWLAALTNAAVPMPAEPALLWVDVGGTRLFAARLGSG